MFAMTSKSYDWDLKNSQNESKNDQMTINIVVRNLFFIIFIRFRLLYLYRTCGSGVASLSTL